MSLVVYGRKELAPELVDCLQHCVIVYWGTASFRLFRKGIKNIEYTRETKKDWTLYLALVLYHWIDLHGYVVLYRCLLLASKNGSMDLFKSSHDCHPFRLYRISVYVTRYLLRETASSDECHTDLNSDDDFLFLQCVSFKLLYPSTSYRDLAWNIVDLFYIYGISYDD